jgi:hypothetical protein
MEMHDRANGRRYMPDTERAKAARDFAYLKRLYIHSAFDDVKLKADVLRELSEMYERAGNPDV